VRLGAILLAAGGSTRLGRPKQLLELEGEVLLRRAARFALEAGFSPLHVVLGARAGEVAGALVGLDVTILRNEAWEEGLASSIRTGVAALPEDVDGTLLLVCDQPALDAALLRSLGGLFHGDPSRPAACAYGGSAGIPAILPRSHFHALLALKGDRGAKALLGDARLLPFPGGDEDVDTPADAARLLRR
jgi:molybdenum cofactor cytidylyltransferase